jgi:phosphonate degradation associated HDIG domain protein
MLQSITKQIVQLFNTKGGSMYGGEAVTQLEHALQAATLAKESGASDELITASLLHDIGHLLHDLPDDSTDKGIDDVHEALAAEFLEKYFKDSVVEPVKLHVAAKRYLCVVDKDYYQTLSQPSKVSLEVQGGVMSELEVTNFEQNKFYQDAVVLRKWDDLAKDPNFKTLPVESFINIIENSLK